MKYYFIVLRDFPFVWPHQRGSERDGDGRGDGGL